MGKTLYGSLVWLIATLFVVYSFCLNTAAAVFAGVIRTSLHASNIGVSLATGAFILGFALMQIPAGYLLDRFNARLVVSAGVLLLAVGNLVISWSSQLTLFAAANFLQGIGASFAFVASAILISQWFSARLFPVLFGLTQTISCVLAGVIHYYFTLLLLTHSWNEIYRHLSLLGFVLLVLCFVFVKTPSDFKRGQPQSMAKTLGIVLHNKQMMLCSLAGALSFGVLLAYASMWYMPVQVFYHVNNLDAVIISGFIFMGIGVGTPVLGWLSNLYHSRTMIIHFSIVYGTMALLLGIYLPHYDLNSLAITKLISFLIGFLLSGSMLFYTMMSELSNDATRGVAISVLNTAVFLLNTMMLFIPYFIITATSREFFTYLWVLPFSELLAISFLYFIKDTYPG